MSNLKDTILLNGKIYSVSGGTIMSPVFPLDIVKSRPVKSTLVKSRSQAHTKHTPHASKSRPAHPPAKHAHARKPQRSNTLMRHTVNKPLKKNLHTAEAHTKEHAKPQKELFTGLHNAGRVVRAIETPRSNHISRFGRISNHTVHIRRNVALEVKSPPSISSYDQPDALDRVIQSLSRR